MNTKKIMWLIFLIALMGIPVSIIYFWFIYGVIIIAQSLGIVAFWALIFIGVVFHLIFNKIAKILVSPLVAHIKTEIQSLSPSNSTTTTSILGSSLGPLGSLNSSITPSAAAAFHQHVDQLQQELAQSIQDLQQHGRDEMNKKEEEKLDLRPVEKVTKADLLDIE